MNCMYVHTVHNKLKIKDYGISCEPQMCANCENCEIESGEDFEFNLSC